MMRHTDLYIAAIPDAPIYRPLLPAERQEQLDATRNERVRAQRYTAWITLLAGLRFSRGLDAADANLKKHASGKWTSDKCGISISHCKTAVAAAVADGAVGVDIEPGSDARYTEKLLRRIETDAERALFSDLPAEQRIAAIWTRKEAAFKREAKDACTPIEADASAENIRTVKIRLDRDYLVSVATEKGASLRVFEVRDDLIAERTDFETLEPDAL